MQMTTLSEREELDEFAKRAAKAFADKPEWYTYTDGEISQGELFAIRFGLDGDCVVVFRIGDMESINYQQIIGSTPITKES